MKTRFDWPSVVLGLGTVLAIAGMTTVAMLKGIDGMAYAGGVGAITAIVGGIFGFRIAKR